LCANIDLNRIADRVSVEPYAIGRSRDNVSVATSGPSAMHHVDTEGSSSLIEMSITNNPWLRTTTAKNNRSDNTLYLRDIEKVKRRVAPARPFRVFGRSI
jgi:hypothetical protein